MVVSRGFDTHRLLTFSKHATSLVFAGSSTISEVGMDPLSRLPPPLTSLDLSCCPAVGDLSSSPSPADVLRKAGDSTSRAAGSERRGFRSIAERCGSLGVLRVNRCPDLTDRSLAKVSELHKIKSLEFAGCPKTSDYGLRLVLEGAPTIRHLRCADSMTGSAFMFSDGSAPSLTELRAEIKAFADRDDVSAAAAAQLAKPAPVKLAEGLQTLDLTGCTTATDAAIDWVTVSCKGIKRLLLAHCLRVSDESLRSFATNCGLLQEVDVSFCDKLTNKGLVTVARGCPTITRLNVTGVKLLDSSALQAIVDSCRKMEVLRAGNLPSLSDEFITSIPPRPLAAGGSQRAGFGGAHMWCAWPVESCPIHSSHGRARQDVATGAHAMPISRRRRRRSSVHDSHADVDRARRGGHSPCRAPSRRNGRQPCNLFHLRRKLHASLASD